MDKETRKLVEHDAFREGVGHSIGYVQSHQSQLYKYGGAALAVAAIAAGAWYFTSRQKAARQADLADALRNKEGIVGPGTPNDPRPAFPTKEDKEKAEIKGFTDVVVKHSGTDEAAFAAYQLGVIASDKGNMDEAAKHFKSAAEMGGREIASAANLSLAQVYFTQNKMSEAEALLRGIINSPTLVVSKEQATMALVRIFSKTKPADARKLLDPYLKDSRDVIKRNAEVLVGEIPVNK
ncbi:MAG: tetratricopeptide repeat protein [Acidobacteria bacterium]|nr:tetratricopeptide repeat protein [Acidobacteriota bacterium]